MTFRCVDCVGNVLLLLVIGISILGLSMKVRAMFVKSVPKCLIENIILISTSGLSIRVRNHFPVLNVVKTSHIGVILDGIGVTIRANQPRRSGSEKNKLTV